MKAHLQDLLRAALDVVTRDAAAPLTPTLVVDATKDAKFGDFQTNLALAIAKPLGLSPRAAAERLVAALPPSARVAKVEIAGPGFINFFLNQSAFQNAVADILAQGEKFGRDDSGSKGKVMVEFVSANPTGPMHVGHGRGAAYGDALANLLAATGHTVWREYYINDAGRQVDVLAVSVWLRYLEACGESVPVPRRGYPGDYIKATAAKLLAREGKVLHHAAAKVLSGLPVEPLATDNASETEKEQVKAGQEVYLDALIARVQALLGARYLDVQRFALEDQLASIRATLTQFNVRFDEWYSERDLVESGTAQKARAQLVASGHTYEQDGALWFRTTERGDDKDRVLVRANGTATYFGNDLAYHVDKMARGWDTLIDVWGADHHGLLKRMEAALEILTGRSSALKIELIQFVTLSSGRMGKRSGNFVTLQDLLDEAGPDATRFFYLLRAHEQHLEFDIDLARSKSNDNPVFYVQYAHARICSVFAKVPVYDRALGVASLARLDTEHEKRLLTALNRFPEAIRNAAANHAPHQLAFYLKDELADALHSYYNAHKFIVEDAALQNARLALIEATRQVLKSGLGLLGVSAPESM